MSWWRRRKKRRPMGPIERAVTSAEATRSATLGCLPPWQCCLCDAPACEPYAYAPDTIPLRGLLCLDHLAAFLQEAAPPGVVVAQILEEEDSNRWAVVFVVQGKGQYT